MKFNVLQVLLKKILIPLYSVFPICQMNVYAKFHEVQQIMVVIVNILMNGDIDMNTMSVVICILH